MSAARVATPQRADTRHAWLQKHASPAASRGEFHWYPADGDAELRARFVERASGLDAPAVLWRFARGQVAWAQLFAAVAPSDGRRYTGMTLSIAQRDGAATHELLAALTVPVAGPHDGAAPPTRFATSALPGATWVARALLGEDVTTVPDASAVSPRTVAALERLLPAALRDAVREGGCRLGEPDAAARRDLPAELLVAASTSAAGSTPTRAWALLCELAHSMRRSPDEICDELGILWADGALTAEERASLGHSGDFASLLNAWGRGRLDGSTTAPTLPARLADAVALRALAQLVDGDDPARAVAEARWHALLPADRRAKLVSALVMRAPSLLAVIGARHA